MLKVPNVRGSNNVSTLSTNFNANFDGFTCAGSAIGLSYSWNGMPPCERNGLRRLNVSWQRKVSFALVRA